MEPGPDSFSSRETPEDLVSLWLRKAIATGDSVRLAEALAPGFRFELQPIVADTLQARGFLPDDSTSWGRAEDLGIFGQIFRSAQVDTVLMTITQIRSNVPDTTCAGCRRLETDLHLSFWIDDGSLSEPVILGGDLEQTFIVGPDPTTPGSWVIEYQIDDQRRFRAVSVARDSWSYIKSLFLLGYIE
jgi:hypothetical protein